MRVRIGKTEQAHQCPMCGFDIPEGSITPIEFIDGKRVHLHHICHSVKDEFSLVKGYYPKSYPATPGNVTIIKKAVLSGIIDLRGAAARLSDPTLQFESLSLDYWSGLLRSGNEDRRRAEAIHRGGPIGFIDTRDFEASHLRPEDLEMLDELVDGVLDEMYGEDS